MPENVVITNKGIGETPLECLEKERILRNIPNTTPMTYAGRLDPMAEGLMILLVGEECKNKEKYLGFDKTYEFEILVGFETDTYDLLGKVTECSNEGLRMVWPSFQKNLARKSEDLSNSLFECEEVNSVLKSFVSTFIQKYPSFSSKTVGGKQLFQLSKDDELPDELPEHEVTISRLECTDQKTISKEDLHNEIERRINLVHGDFRQQVILKKWDEALDKTKEKEYKIFSCVCDCSSGTYIRQLVEDIGKKIGIPLVTYSINRVKVGEYKI